LKTHDLLIEIGVEEIPADHLGPATEFIRSAFLSMTGTAGLSFGELNVSSTPRRFFVLTTGLQETQADSILERTGPAIRIAYDDNGGLTPAALGFLKKNNASPQDITIQKTDKGEFLQLRITCKGRPAREIVSEWISALLPQIPFPKKMIWNSRDFAFSRPLRWICALWDTEVLELEAGNLRTGRISFGNRYLGLDHPVPVESPSQYLSTLSKHGVVADRRRRREVLTRELETVIRDEGYAVVGDERLIDTVCDLVEQAHAVEASFPEEYLSLPEKIITSTISQNQKYFSVTAPNGRLSNRFVFISNGDPKHDAVIRHGNEKVVRSRLADAMWYFREDCRKPLESYVPLLKDVVFQSKLGTLDAKRQRCELLCGYICQELQLTSADTQKVLRCARLAKADLVTTMLGEKEFTKLQGYIGMHYALASGEDADVAQGIYEHYMPRGSNDGLPDTLCGSIVAVADKLDTVCGIIGVGMLPTGSADPFALRRAANGVVQIALERDWPIGLMNLVDRAIEGISAQVEMVKDAATNIRGFMEQRVQWLLKQEGFDYDVIESVLSTGIGSPGDLKKRCTAVAKMKQSHDFIRLVIGFKRAANIIKDDSQLPPPDPSLFRDAAETALYDALQQLQEEVGLTVEAHDHDKALWLLTDFGKHINVFFDAVLVNCENPALRTNRHALLAKIKDQFLRIADISRIVVDTESGE
jgi:glycyl-tRNA synthetase beta chain